MQQHFRFSRNSAHLIKIIRDNHNRIVQKMNQDIHPNHTRIIIESTQESTQKETWHKGKQFTMSQRKNHSRNYNCRPRTIQPTQHQTLQGTSKKEFLTNSRSQSQDQQIQYKISLSWQHQELLHRFRRHLPCPTQRFLNHFERTAKMPGIIPQSKPIRQRKKQNKEEYANQKIPPPTLAHGKTQHRNPIIFKNQHTQQCRAQKHHQLRNKLKVSLILNLQAINAKHLQSASKKHRQQHKKHKCQQQCQHLARWLSIFEQVTYHCDPGGIQTHDYAPIWVRLDTY